MKPLGLTNAQLVKRSKKTRKAELLKQIVPWSRLLALVEPYYSKPGRGRCLLQLQSSIHA